MRWLSSPVPAAQSASGRGAPILCHTATEETTCGTSAGSIHSRGRKGVQSMNRLRAAAVAAPTSLIREIQRDLASGARSAADVRRHCLGARVHLMFIWHIACGMGHCTTSLVVQAH